MVGRPPRSRFGSSTNSKPAGGAKFRASPFIRTPSINTTPFSAYEKRPCFFARRIAGHHAPILSGEILSCYNWGQDENAESALPGTSPGHLRQGALYRRLGTRSLRPRTRMVRVGPRGGAEAPSTGRLRPRGGAGDDGRPHGRRRGGDAGPVERDGPDLS